MKLSIQINLDNAAYQDDLMGELNSQFMMVLNRIAIDDDTGVIFDTNGNKTGAWSIYEDSYE
jgi:hypothetical protein